ncbi:MAG: hypothetical protein Q9191_003264 [Dirinaria sp. TL-2023a]
MASQVVVVDSSARRVVVKTTPGKHLSEILHEACSKWGKDASLHGLKHNNKTLDLSNPIRLSGLSSGARLELIKISKSPSVVSVALQVPESDGQGIPNNRMTDKFPSTTSLWQILRKFESGAAGGLGLHKNFTARSTAQIANGNTGSGRLYYETPVLNYMGREVSDFVGLQQSLGQLGFTGGNTLLRLTFRATQDPLETTMEDIERYFKSVEGHDDSSRGAHAASVGTGGSVSDTAQPALTEEEAGAKSPAEPPSPLPPPTEPLSPARSEDLIASSSISGSNGRQTEAGTPLASTPSTASEHTVTGPGGRLMAIYAPSSSTVPRAAQQAYNEADYVPTIAHAKMHQKRLQNGTHNQRLASYAEDDNKQKARAQRLTEIKELKLKVRFPDQQTIWVGFNDLDTATTLYDWARKVLVHEGAPFVLKYSTAKGPQEVPVNSTQRLIAGLGMVGPLLVNFVWAEGADPEARSSSVLKPEYATKAKEIEVPEIPGQDVAEENPAPSTSSENARPSGGGSKGGIPKWLQKGLRKK